MGSDSTEKGANPMITPLIAHAQQYGMLLLSPNSGNGSPPASPYSPRHRQHVRSSLFRIQCGIIFVIGLLVCTTMNVARLTGHVYDAVEVEVHDGKAGVVKALKGFTHMQEKALNAMQKDDDDKYVKLPKDKVNKALLADTKKEVKQQPIFDTHIALTPEQQAINKAVAMREKERQQIQLEKERAHNLMERARAKAHTEDPRDRPNVDSEGNPLTDIQRMHLYADKGQHFTEELSHEEELLFGFPLKHHDDHHRVHADYLARKQHHGNTVVDSFGQDIARPKWIEAPDDKTSWLDHPNVSPNDFRTEGGIPKRPNVVYHNRWEHQPALPKWSKDYFVWHDAQRQKLTQSNWNLDTDGNNFRFLIMTCYANQTCGNVHHRLRPIPTLLRIAYDTQRILLLHWGDREKDRLEAYVEPPHHGGLNWTLPEFMYPAAQAAQQYQEVETIALKASNKDTKIVATMVHDDLFGEPYFNARRFDDTEEPADRIFHDVYHVLFKPTYLLQERLQETHHTMGLPPGQYASVHIEYEELPTTDAGKKALRDKVQNAMNCVSNLRPGGPFLVAAQTYAIAKEAVKYGKQQGVVVAARQIAHDSSYLPKDLHNSWLEFYFMANTRCVAYGRAGYGQLGYIMGMDYNCRLKYEGYDSRTQCTWTKNMEEVMQLQNAQPGAFLSSEGELAEADFKPETDDDAVHIHEANAEPHGDSAAVEKGMPTWLQAFQKNAGTPNPEDMWNRSETLPDWLKAYFSWHKQEKQKITETNWKDFRYLVMTCYGGQKCGTVAHRLRPLPVQLRIAAQSHRLLLIHWDKPQRLEYFVEPPTVDVGPDETKIVGMDWLVPDYMLWKVRASQQQTSLDVVATMAKQANRKVVNVMYNQDDEGEPYYNDRLADKELTADHVLKDVFHAMFQPTVLLQDRMKEMLDHVGLEPGKYAVAHIDYPFVPKTAEEKEHVQSHVDKALSCLSQIAPPSDTKYLVFSETLEAAMYAVNFGMKHDVKIPAKQLASMHDKTGIPTDLMGSFAEVYIMANAKCVSYNRGEFGQLGYLLGQDYDCKIRYAGKDAQECQWKGPSAAAKRLGDTAGKA